MRAVHVFSTYLHMTENWCYRLIKNLPDTEIDIVCEQLLNEGSFTLPDAGVHVMPTVRYNQTLPWPIRKAFGALRRAKALYWRLHLTRHVKEADLIHAHFSIMGWNYLWLSRKTGLPLVVSFYGYDYERLPKREPVWLGRYKQLFNQAALFITEGEAGRGKLINMGCPEHKVKVAHLGVELDNIPMHKRAKQANHLSLVQIATITGKKGHDTTVRAFIRATGDCPDMTLTLVGSDAEGLKAGLLELITDAGVQDKVTFVDAIDFSELHGYLAGFQVFIHPSIHAPDGDSEGGAPVVLLDAQATGMPVLSTTHCDIPGEVINGKTGILVGEGDVEGLAGAIATFYRMTETEYRGYCENARKHIEVNFDAVKCGACLKALYHDALASNGFRH